ncbi:MAG: aminomethyl-transferring glycine dehydrogenase [Chitinophagales bacterium]
MRKFVSRHLGPRTEDVNAMLKVIGDTSINELIDKTIPNHIRFEKPIEVCEELTEYEYLKELKNVSLKNKVNRSLIGLGYYNTIIPGVIQRNIFENPGWYTQYTPYQAEIAQGRLEALLNFQTMVSDLTGLPIANASLLDEGTAAAEAMQMLYALKNKKQKKDPKQKCLISKGVFPQTLDVIKSRALSYDIELVVDTPTTDHLNEDLFAVILQYPDSEGKIENFSAIIEKAKLLDIYVVMVADIMSLALLKSPGELGVDVAVGNTQRFGVPMGFGGPHAAYFACQDEFKRHIPGRIIGVSVDKHGNNALRMALQTREQHIKRERATSNICTAQALLAIMAGMYAVYHGPKGLKEIALDIHFNTVRLANELSKLGFEQTNTYYFDTLNIKTDKVEAIRTIAEANGFNFNYFNSNAIGIALDETITQSEVTAIAKVFAEAAGKSISNTLLADPAQQIPVELQRTSSYFEHPIFNQHHSETEMLRYIKKLENRDLSLTTSMIPLGSCTMKLNATSELLPLSWRQFSEIHPFAPADQVQGYLQIIHELEQYLCTVTGFDACSLQPNSGAQGEFAGLMVIKAFHEANGDFHRNIALIPSSAHGTNPASAVMAGMEVVVVKTDEMGNIDVPDLIAKAKEHCDNLSCLMVTYPSTHGVYESSIKDICKAIHDNGGKVYMDGANMNAQVGLTSPAIIGADVCHLNLHKTFAIPHGGGGPGMGPICVTQDLADFLPGNPLVKTGGSKAIPAISAAPWGSASILLISYGYIKMLGSKGLLEATKYAILNANYLKSRLEDHYPILYVGENGKVAHEFIIDFRHFKELNIEVADVAKRLMDYGFHAPTVSFPVAGTLMIEPTESEPLEELDRFVDAMIAIRKEIEAIADGQYSKEDNPIINAPHTAAIVSGDQWDHCYSRQVAAFPTHYQYETKFWPYVGKIDNGHGDRNLICTCPPLEEYA